MVMRRFLLSMKALCAREVAMSSGKGPRAHINPYVAGVLLGVVLFAAFMLTGAGLGASGAVSNVQTAVMKVVAQDHVDRTRILAEKGGGERNPLFDPSVFMLLGTFLGGLASGLINRRVRPEARKGPRISNGTRLILALVGGAIMGYGARISRGCTSGQALSGGAVLSAGSFAFMFAVFAGGYLLAWFVRRLWV